MKDAVRLISNPKSEAQHQMNVMNWSLIHRAEYPELRLLHHIKNETTGGPGRVAIDRAMGVKKGLPDLCLPVARGTYHGLYIELKTTTGRASEAQNWWGEELRAQGYCATICRGWESATQTIEWYMGLKGEIKNA